MKIAFSRREAIALAVAAGVVGGAQLAYAAETTLLNVSYDPTRELYQAYNEAFAKHWKEKTGEDVKINQSHGGSGKQARAIIDGLDADVATLALAGDIDALVKKDLVKADWRRGCRTTPRRTPRRSSSLSARATPRPSRTGPISPSGVEVVTRNPKTSGGARWNCRQRRATR